MRLRDDLSLRVVDGRACWGPREPTTPKDRAKSEPKGLQQAQGVPEVARCQAVQSTVCHGTSQTPRNTAIW